MFYIITSIFFVVWAVLIIKKIDMSLHSIISIYVVTVFLVDWGDVFFYKWVNFYDIPAKIFRNIDVGNYLGIMFSDGIIFPASAIIFCYYSIRYRRPWLLSILFSSMFGVIEFIFRKYGFMVYHHWNSFATPIITFISLLILSRFSYRFVNYYPPVSYKFRIMCFIYTIGEWPGGITAATLHLYLFRPHVFTDETADSRLVGMITTTLLSVITAIIIDKIHPKYRIVLFAGLGICYSIFAFWLYSKGYMIYNHWNHMLTVIRYLVPFIVVYFYDKWESSYSNKLHLKAAINDKNGKC
ncbi:MAG TPA: hypothetical protein VF941_03880 [Clostridia bacterium]